MQTAGKLDELHLGEIAALGVLDEIDLAQTG